MAKEKWELFGNPHNDWESWESKYKFYELRTRRRVDLFAVWWNSFYCYPRTEGEFILYRMGDRFLVVVAADLDDDEDKEEYTGLEKYNFESDYELAKWMAKRLYREEHGRCSYILCDFKEDV